MSKNDHAAVIRSNMLQTLRASLRTGTTMREVAGPVRTWLGPVKIR